MSERFTKAVRQEIVREFAIRHNGHFNPALFIAEVEARGEEHPAYSWFEWDQEKAAREYRLDQARDFASGLRVSFTVEEVGRDSRFRDLQDVVNERVARFEGM